MILACHGTKIQREANNAFLPQIYPPGRSMINTHRDREYRTVLFITPRYHLHRTSSELDHGPDERDGTYGTRGDQRRTGDPALAPWTRDQDLIDEEEEEERRQDDGSSCNCCCCCCRGWCLHHRCVVIVVLEWGREEESTPPLPSPATNRLLHVENTVRRFTRGRKKVVSQRRRQNSYPSSPTVPRAVRNNNVHAMDAMGNGMTNLAKSSIIYPLIVAD